MQVSKHSMYFQSIFAITVHKQYSGSISTAVLLSDFCIEIPPRVNTAPCWPQHNTCTATAACSCKGWRSSPAERWTMSIQNKSSINRGNKGSSLSGLARIYITETKSMLPTSQTNCSHERRCCFGNSTGECS